MKSLNFKSTKGEVFQKKFYTKAFSRPEQLKYNLLPWRKSYVDRIKRMLLDNDYRNKNLIDIGAGSGYVAIEMAKLGMKKVYACDLVPQSINNIKRFKKQFNLNNLECFTCNADKIPLPDHSIDYVVANALLDIMPDEKEAVVEWKRILKPKGKIFIVVGLSYWYCWPFFIPFYYFYDKHVGHLRKYTEKTLKEIFNLPIKHTFYTGHFIKVLHAILKLLNVRILSEEKINEIDKKKEKNPYGATNIGVVLEKV